MDAKLFPLLAALQEAAEDFQKAKAVGHGFAEFARLRAAQQAFDGACKQMDARSAPRRDVKAYRSMGAAAQSESGRQ